MLVFYRFVEERLQILKRFKATPVDAPGAIDRWNAGEIAMLVAHPDSAGHGLNLQHGGHTIVFTSPPWSLEAYQQSVGRLARQGQKSPTVVVHRLVCPDTVDVRVLEVLAGKTTVQDALLNALLLKDDELG